MQFNMAMYVSVSRSIPKILHHQNTLIKIYSLKLLLRNFLSKFEVKYASKIESLEKELKYVKSELLNIGQVSGSTLAQIFFKVLGKLKN